ncbi:MAG: universal stress protein [Acidobacteria bacterium]|nr:universal stress protein [Acidobacteriota bacterium]
MQQLHKQRPDLDVHGEVMHGDVEQMLMAESVSGSILALGTGGDAAVRLPHRSAMLGRLAHRAVGPVALVPVGWGALAGPVVAGVDGTEAGVAAARIAAAEAQSVDASVIIVHVRLIDSTPPDWPNGPMDAVARELATHYPHLLVRQRVVRGAVREELLRSTKTASLMVLGRHARSGPASDLVEDALAATSTVPLLIVSETDLLGLSQPATAMSSTMHL